MSGGLNVSAFYSVLDTIRSARQTSWYAVANELGIPRSTFTRLKNGNKPDADSLTKLLIWSGADIRNFTSK